MNKNIKKAITIIAIIAIVFIIIWLCYEIFKKDAVDINNNSNLVDTNTGLDNIINELFENDVMNNEIENSNIIENDTIKNNSKVENTVSDDEPETTEKTTSKEEKAISLAKKEWGSTSGVYFSNEGINSDGRYIISVRDGKTTNSLAFYLVDVEKELVTQW